MIQLILNNVKKLIFTGILSLLGFLWSFGAMGYRTRDENIRQDRDIAQIKSDFASIKERVDENIGITKEVRDNTRALRDVLYKRAVKE